MKQVLQNLRSGVTELLDVPAPQVSAGNLLIATRASLISAGTERSLVEFGKASLVSKARQNPERVRQVLDKIKSDGLLPTLEAVFAKLDAPMPLGYCNAGVVVETGRDVAGFAIGDRVASNGPHAEILNQPVNLAAKIPEGVSDEEAAFTPLAAIALQGVRLLSPQVGECVAVFGLGLVGLMAVQILRASGCRVLAIDVDVARLALAEKFGAAPLRAGETADVVAAAKAFSSGYGVDGVLIAASAKEDQIIHQAAEISRQRGRIVLVGAVNMHLNRADFYEKELTFQVSCSYGPGRYDPRYEEQGVDYPQAFVRWTEKRNFEAVLELMSRGLLDVRSLITSRVPHAEASRAYDALSKDRSQLGIVFEYPETPTRIERTIAVHAASSESTCAVSRHSAAAGRAVIGVIGAGNFTVRALLPGLAKTDAVLASVASAGGVSAAYAARKFGFESSTTDYRTLLANPRINTIFITTRHDTHARMAAEALAAGKHLFVEKPLAIDEDGLALVRSAYESAGDRQLMVGFNRRFAPQVVRMKQLLGGRSGPACATVLVNAGAIPADHWTHDPRIGGGRIIGEGCHWIDLLRFLVGAPIVAVQAAMIGDAPGVETRDDHTSITLSFADGSLGTIHYLANGHRAFAKERIEVFCDEKVLELDNFRVLRGYGWTGFKRMRLFRQDKGHNAEISGFVARAAKGGPPLIEPNELWNVTEASFAAVRAARTGERIDLTSTMENHTPRAAIAAPGVC